jgi:hypothetical protein
MAGRSPIKVRPALSHKDPPLNSLIGLTDCEKTRLLCTPLADFFRIL